MSNQRYVTAAQLSARTGLTDRYFRKMAAEGRIPGAFQPSGPRGVWRFDLGRFKQWWASKESKPKQWQVSINGAPHGGAEYKETGNFCDEAFEQRLDRLQKSVLGNG